MPESSAFNIPNSPIAALGTLTLLVAFLVAAYAVTAGFIGNAKENRRLVGSSVYALYGFFALMMLASARIIFGFVSHDYSIKYIARYSDTTMPLHYKIASYWGGLDGSLMFWVSVLAAFAATAVRANHRKHKDMIGYVVGVIMLVQLFFLALLIYNKNPFSTFLTEAPVDGKGLNPLLQNYWMVIHPPSLYIGFVAATIPFAFGMAALLSGRLDDQWLSSVRSWTLICWFFLSFGLILGGRWAYEELGWGGYWAWDPVENAGLLPWFTATAFLHSAIIQEQRGMMKPWNLSLVILTFFLTIFGTFMTRSGVVQSVHAFGEDNQLALLFILFMGAILILSFGLLVDRLPRLRSSNTFESFASREFAFVLNNWILLACAFFVLFATMFPTISEAVTGDRITVGPPFFNKWMIPMGLILLFLAGAAPLLAYRRTSRKRLSSQFLYPVAFGVLTVVVCAVFFPETRALTSIFVPVKFLAKVFSIFGGEGISLPITLINFFLIAFTLGSIFQEFWIGTRVRRKQTGGDPVTSLLGIVIAKQRKYGGYIVHLGVAIMFFGFAGKTFEGMEDFTLSKPLESFSIRGYTAEYQRLESVDDDHKHAVTAYVNLKRGDSLLTELRPARWQYKKLPDQPTTEVDIYSTISEDFYIILTGFNPGTGLANFRVYVNPLINWVWIGFVILAFGTAICLLPGAWTQRRRAADVGALAALLVAGSLLFPNTAFAQGGGAEYQEASAHQVGVSAAHLHRPNSERLLAPYRGKVSDNEMREIVKLSGKLMKDLVCLCGGCSRETLLECRCGFAAGEREEILGLLATHDLSTAANRDLAYKDVVDSFVAKYESRRAGDGQRILMTPQNGGFNSLSWAVPYTVLAGALAALFFAGRRWVGRGNQVIAAGGPKRSEEDQKYADLLDDELRETD